MWKLKIAGDGEWVSSGNGNVGRQEWVFNPTAGTPEEKAAVEKARREFKNNRFNAKQSADLLMRMQNEDGGWGLHIEGHSTMFGSALSYICLRLLGESPEDGEDMAVFKGRKWILDHGGLVSIPSWGKFWVSVLGLYEWSGCNPFPPEFWLVPLCSPIHPGKMLCYCRLVYMPMSYLYGKRFVGPITGLIRTLREELYNEPYHKVNWNAARNTVAKEDLYYPHPLVQDMTWGFIHHFMEPLLTRWPFSKLRNKALGVAMEHIHYEDENSKYLCIGCVEKVLCLMACWVEDPNSDACKKHLARLQDYYWIAEDGLKMQTFGCQTWDAVFAIQAIMSSNLCDEYGPTLRKAHEFLKASQTCVTRYKRTLVVTSRQCIGTSQKVHGPSQLKIMDGKFLIALLKDSR
ncbi:unnamed protein product [Linum tenue]|uniref:Squalene cyclase N-terminal domain-containing protein n=1 Tax=Linum tenue TaxID=586396 RepID=A0AAV0R6M6_9ROSI|nr:unnamed protein product [Linum tenue]